MGVITVIGAEGVQVLVEFLGGPRDGKRVLAIAPTHLEGKPIPPSGFGSGQLSDGPAEATGNFEAGNYVCQGLTPDGEAYAYVWHTPPAAPEVPMREPAPLDLATRIRRAYARRATSDAELPEEPKRGPLASRRETTDRGGA
jgi:hypothetical protein